MMNRPAVVRGKKGDIPRGGRKPQVPPPPALTPQQIERIEEWVEANPSASKQPRQERAPEP
jgi:hypothetical protein